MDLRSRRKLAFVVERYGAEDTGETGRRTRALAAAVAGRGHDVTVVTTCARLPGDWHNELAEGESALDGARVVRFPVEPLLGPLRRRLLSQGWLAGSRWGRDAWLDAIGPVSPGLEHYLHRLGAQFDAVFFTGAWGRLPARGARLVRTAVLAPPALDEPLRALAHVPELLGGFRAVAVESIEHKDLLGAECRGPMPPDAFVIGSCCEPCPRATLRLPMPRLCAAPSSCMWVRTALTCTGW